jgi:hypothetical protein
VGLSYLPKQHSRRSVPLLTSDEVRRFAAKAAKLPWLQNGVMD